MADIQFEQIDPYVEGSGGDTGRTSRQKLRRNFEKIKAWMDSAASSLASWFLRKDQPDTAQETITFQKGAKFGTYTTGPLGTGGAVVIDQAGNSSAEFDFLTIRKAATFRSITILELKHIGGELGITAGAMKVSRVEEMDDAYRCYFDTTDGKRQVYQEFVLGDQARCQAFRLSQAGDGMLTTKYYWRLVVGVGDDYVDLSKNVADTGSGIPEEGDEVIQLGYRGDDHPERQSAIILSAVASNAPSQKFYQGIDTFALPTPVKDEGYDTSTGLFHTKTYGESYVGKSDQSTYMKFTPTNGVEIKGKVEMSNASTLDGVRLATSIANVQSTANNAQATASAAQTAADNAQTAAGDAQDTADAAQTAAENAQRAAETAKDAADAADERIDNLSTGNENLVVNGGFTGLYQSESVNDNTTVNANTQIFSNPWGRWDVNTGCSIVTAVASSTGVACQMSSGTLTQTIARGITVSQPYTLSLLALSSGTLNVSIGGWSGTITLTNGRRCSVKFTALSSSAALTISGSATISEIQLIQGSVTINDWTPSPEDNNKFLSYYKNFAYLMAAIEQADTSILGGLVLTQQIRVGNYADHVMTQETGGMNGNRQNDDSPFLWGGGSMTQAMETIRFFADDPMADPSEQLANMAKFVVTHGGRAILNDVILNNVYARGNINATSGKVGGFVIDGHALKNKRSGYNPSSSEPSTIDNTAYDPEAVIILENPAKGAYVSVGTNVLPPSLGGSRALVELLSSKDNYEQTDGVNLAMIVGATNALQNIAIAITGGCITNLAVKTAEYGWGTYVTSATDTTPALTRLIAKEACDVFASTEYNWRASDSDSYQKKTRNVYLTLPDMGMCDDGHIIKIKRGPNDGGEFHVIPGRSTYLVNGVPTWSQSVILSEHSDTWCYPTNDNSHDYRLYNEGRGCELVYHRDMTVTISGTTYHGVWIEHKFPRDW